ncbi:MAG TPA: M56 family metallopeptidase, partial [Pyrinomonadaceae bacterium]|nr:M56 family metallopeptidase [Pyrinomonadaceae bacterium]
RHCLWVAALVLSFALPLATSTSFRKPITAVPQTGTIEPAVIAEIPSEIEAPSPKFSPPTINVRQSVAIGLLGLFVGIFSYRSVRLLRAWLRTLAQRRDATPIDPAHRIWNVVARCQEAFGLDQIRVASSVSIGAPAATGIFRPLIILPAALSHEAGDEELTAAIGHELAHVRRRDYLLNLFYEIIFLPVSFHPAAMLMRQRITQTRELSCDELVAELLLHPEVYARSLVRLAGAVMPLTRRARTVTVGIADADILEVRVMSLMKKTKLNVVRKRLLLAAAAILLLIPCAVAAAFAIRLNIDTAQAQEPSRETLEQNREQVIKAALEHQVQELTERIKVETNVEVKAKLEQRLAQVKEQMSKPITLTSEGKPFTVDGEQKRLWELQDRALKAKIEMETNADVRKQLQQTFEKQQLEREALITQANLQKLEVRQGDEEARRVEDKLKAARQIELASRARITMDQAIQIATSQRPGKVLECSLVGEHWESPEKLAADAQILYHVVIVSNDATNPTVGHVLVNAVDGTIVRVLPKEGTSAGPRK